MSALPTRLLLTLAFFSLAPSVRADAPKVDVKEEPIYVIPDGTKVVDTLVSPDNEHLGIIESVGDKFTAVIDGVRGPEHDWVVRGSLSFSAKGGRFCYQVQDGDKLQMFVGTAGKQWSAAADKSTFFLIGRAVFNADGTRLAYVGQKKENGKATVVVDGKEQPAFDEVVPSEMQFSPDGKHFAYRARTADGSDDTGLARPGGKQFYVVDAVQQPGFDSVGRLVFSPDGSRWGYSARSQGNAFMVIDGKQGSKFAVVAGLTFSSDGRQYTYAVETGTSDGKPSGKQSLVYSGGGPEKQFRAFDGIGAIAFSPDGSRIATTVLENGKWSVFVDGKSSGTYDGTGGLLFSPDSKRLAVVAGRGKQQYLIVDGKEYPPVEVVATGTFSPDSKSVAIAAVQGGQRVLFLEDKQVGPATFFAFSPDSRWIGHVLPMAAGRFQVALSGQAVGPVLEVSPPGSKIVWDAPNVAHLIAGRGTTMMKLTLTLAK